MHGLSIQFAIPPEDDVSQKHYHDNNAAGKREKALR